MNPLAPAPPYETFGQNTYRKGATVAHTLRGYLGDDKFFDGIRRYMVAKKFGNATSADFRDFMAEASGVSLDAFFDGWVFTSGHAHFRIDSFAVKSSSVPEHEVTLYLGQDQRYKPILIDDNRLEVMFLDARGNEDVQTVTFSGASGVVKVTVPFAPTVVLLDPEARTADAKLSQLLQIDQTGADTLYYLDFILDVKAAPRWATLQITNHFVPSAGAGSRGLRPASHYWTVDGVLPEGWAAGGSFLYDGNEGYDRDWLKIREDSLVLYYRRTTAEPWLPAEGAVQNLGNDTRDRIGSFEVSALQLGQYTFCVRDKSYTGRPAVLTAPAPAFTLAPNPARNEVTVTWTAADVRHVSLLDLNGRVLQSHPAAGGNLTLALADRPAGVYIVRLEGPAGAYYGKLVVTD